MQSHTYRGRFAPSPTGPLHFGSLIAALGSYLQARHQHGQWLVRIEDIDPPREMPGASDDILRTLEAYGFEWDEEVTYQSRRSDVYLDGLAQLRHEGVVYPCTCSRQMIAAAVQHGPLIYPGTCRSQHHHEGKPHALRVLTDNSQIIFMDLIQGNQTVNLEQEIGDFVVRRSDGLFSYQLAVAMDDVLQAISQVVRGADLLDSTPRQIHLQQLLGCSAPEYAHLPVATNVHGEKLSKQTFAAALDKTAPVPTLCSAMRFLGHPPPAQLEHTKLTDFWNWAMSHWHLDAVPRKQAISAEPAGKVGCLNT